MDEYYTKHFNPSKVRATKEHMWARNEEGNIDEYNWERGYHMGPRCVVCDEQVCTCCSPNWRNGIDIGECHEHYVCAVCGKHITELIDGSFPNFCSFCGEFVGVNSEEENNGAVL